MCCCRLIQNVQEVAHVSLREHAPLLTLQTWPLRCRRLESAREVAPSPNRTSRVHESWPTQCICTSSRVHESLHHVSLREHVPLLTLQTWNVRCKTLLCPTCIRDGLRWCNLPSRVHKGWSSQWTRTPQPPRAREVAPCLTKRTLSSAVR